MLENLQTFLRIADFQGLELVEPLRVLGLPSYFQDLAQTRATSIPRVSARPDDFNLEKSQVFDRRRGGGRTSLNTKGCTKMTNIAENQGLAPVA